MKDNFKLLNNVDMDLDKYEDLNIDKDKLKKKMRTQIKTKNKFKKNISVAASICIVGIGLSSVGVLNQSLAYNVPILGSMLQMIQNSLNNNNDNLLDSYTEVNKSFSKDGLTVKIDKVVYSNNQIFMELELKTDVPFEESKYAKTIVHDPREQFADSLELVGRDWKFSINNKKMQNYSFASPRFHYIDEYTLKGNMLIDFKSPIDESNEYDIFKMEFNLEAVDYDRETNEYNHIEDINGPWSLEFPVKSNISKTKTIRPKVTQDDITVQKVVLTQTSLNLNLSSKENIGLYAEVKDDRGNILSGAGLGISTGDTYDGDYYLNNIGQDMNYITVLAYKENSNGSSELITEIKINLK